MSAAKTFTIAAGLAATFTAASRAQKSQVICEKPGFPSRGTGLLLISDFDRDEPTACFG